MEKTFRSKVGDAGDEKIARAQDLVERVTVGDPTQGYSDEEAAAMIANVLPNLSPDQLRMALNASVQNFQANAAESDRAALQKMLEQRQAGQGMIDITRTGENVPAGAPGGHAGADTIGLDDLLGGLLGGGAQGQAGGGGGLGDILGGLLGGGGQAQSGGGGGLGDILGGLLGGGGQQASPGASNAPGLDDILGGLLGGGQPQATAEATADPSGGMMGQLGDIMSNPLAKAVLAGAAAFAMREMMKK